MALAGAGGMAEVWICNGNASEFSGDANAWTQVGSAVILANNYDALVNIPLTGVSGTLGDTIGVWV
jgi:hypothetical protein